MAFAGLLAAALLGEEFDARAAAVVLAVTALPDLDAFVGLVSTVGHRTALHTLVFPALVALALLADTRWREDSALLGRYGDRGLRVAWTSVLALAVAGIGLDLVTGGANPLWPIHDQFYRVSGKVELSTQRGLVQTFVELGDGTSGPQSLGSSEDVFVSTGVDPQQGEESKTVDRVFPVVRSGWQLLVLVVGTAITAAKVWQVETGERGE